MTHASPPARGRADRLLDVAKGRRWFGDKTRAVRRATIRDEIPIEWPTATTRYAVVRLALDTDAGTSTYQLFVETGAGERDALEDAEFRRGLVDGIAANREFTGEGARWILRSESRRPLVVPPAARITLSTAEQSNSSVIVDGVAILKVFRRLEPGIHPDVEVTRFLTIERDFVHVPVLLGTMRFEDATGETVAGMLQELVPGATDAWAYALESSRGWFAGEAQAEVPPFAREAAQLGEVTRALHETLGSGERGGAFEPRAVGDADVARWVEQTLAMIDRATASLRAAMAKGLVPPEHQPLARTAAQRADALRSFVPRIADALGADRGRRTRTHGDYHLGQVIRSAAGQFFVIDFEGEPARPLSERRAHHSPLRDVAGMLRSFAYAAAVAGARAGGTGRERAAAWERASREAFLDAYRAQAVSDLLPHERDHADRLLALFETEKVFYELQYELDHRPDWVWVPLSGIAALAT